MRLYNSDKVIVPEPTLQISNEMIKHHTERTKSHIDKVVRHAATIERKFKKHKGIKEKSLKHDCSKFEAPELNPYILLSWKHKCKKEKCPCKFNPIQLEAMKKASLHHITKNDHHPEAHMKVRDVKAYDGTIPLDATNMPSISLVEMCADFLAMSEELGTDARDWADKVVGNKYKFTKEQVSDIYEILNAISD